MRIAQILERVQGLRNDRLAEADRVVLATNLGALLARFRPGTSGSRGVLSDLLCAAGLARKEDYTKRLGRYIVWTTDVDEAPQGLCARFGPYGRLAAQAAPQCGLTADQAIVALTRGSSLDPLHGGPDIDQATLASLEDLYRLLDHAARQTTRAAGLEEALRNVGRWCLNSDDQGLTFYAFDHPAVGGPEEPEFWEERLDLLPKVPLTLIPDCDGGADVVATLADGQALTLRVWVEHAVYLTPAVRTPRGTAHRISLRHTASASAARLFTATSWRSARSATADGGSTSCPAPP